MERERMKEVKSFAIIGAGLVGVELATDLKSYFPDKEVIAYTRSGGWLPRVPKADEMIRPETEAQGVQVAGRIRALTQPPALTFGPGMTCPIEFTPP